MPEREKREKIKFAVDCKKDVFFLDKEIEPPKIEASKRKTIFKNLAQYPGVFPDRLR